MPKLFFLSKSYLFNIRVIFTLLILVIVVFLFYLKIIPDGEVVYRRTWPRGLASGQGFIGKFKPAERLVSNNNILKIIADPVYFSVFTPRGFDRVKMTIKYRERLSSSTPIIELGLLRDRSMGAYDLQPLQNDLIDYWRFQWSRLVDDKALLILQAEKNYTDVNNFWADLQGGHLRGCAGEATSCLAFYNYSWPANYSFPDYLELKSLVISQPLLGPHQFYVYFKAGAWRLTFDFNKEDRWLNNSITVNLSAAGELVQSKSWSSANQINNQENKTRQLIISGQAERAGWYKGEVKIDSDIIISKITSSSHKFSFINRVWPTATATDLKIFTDAPYLQISTLNPASLGEIKVAGENKIIDKTYQPFVFKINNGLSEIDLKKGDLLLENSGVFSFGSDSIINPGLKKVDRFFEPHDQTKYIIANYQMPLAEKGIKTVSAEFSLQGVSRDQGRYDFLISIPGLDGRASSSQYLEIQEIKADFSGKNLFTKLKEWLR